MDPSLTDDSARSVPSESLAAEVDALSAMLCHDALPSGAPVLRGPTEGVDPDAASAPMAAL